MSMVNNGLKPKEGEVTSQPWEWPVTFRGQRFTRWGDLDLRVYLLGNPVIYWGALVCLGLMLALAGLLAALGKRQLTVSEG
jgi:dolichyl-phosphate-mannose-protein mannosyltransferase